MILPRLWYDSGNFMSMKRQFLMFCLRWFLNVLGLWITVRLLAEHGVEFSGQYLSLVVGGLLLSIINTILRPIIVVLALPAILLTLGLFMFIVNGLMVYLAAKLTPGIDISFGAAIIAGFIIGIVNYALTGMLELNRERGNNHE
jgi:putative membrane protein